MIESFSYRSIKPHRYPLIELPHTRRETIVAATSLILACGSAYSGLHYLFHKPLLGVSLLGAALFLYPFAFTCHETPAVRRLLGLHPVGFYRCSQIPSLPTIEEVRES